MGRIFHRSVSADVSKGEYSGSPVAIKRLRVNEGGHIRVFKVFSISTVHVRSSTFIQRLCREVIGWRHLIHPNILPLLGISMVTDSNYFDILTEWMPNGNLMQYAKSNSEANRVQLVTMLIISLRLFAC